MEKRRYQSVSLLNGLIFLESAISFVYVFFFLFTTRIVNKRIKHSFPYIDVCQALV